MPANFTTPVGRLLMGSLYTPQTTDAEGKPLVNKSGQNVGQPKVQFFFAVGIAKGPEQHWSQTPWGQIIFNEGRTAFPQAHMAPAFAWKVKDGDSTIPNRVGKRPIDQIGHAGHWILYFTSGFAPKVYNRDGTAAIVEKDAVKPGYFVQVNANVAGNGSVQQPGVFLNHSMVALSAYGEEIIVGPDPTAAGFGQGALPAGAMTAPVGGAFNPQQPAQQSYPGQVPNGLGYMQQYPQADQQQPYSRTNPIPMQQQPGVPVPPPPPNPAILQMPAQQPVRQMTPLAQGATYEQMIQAGWNDELLRQKGMML